MKKEEYAKSVPLFTLEKKKSQCIQFHPFIESYVLEEEDLAAEYNPYRLKNIQKYNPIHSLLFDLSPEESEFISLNQTYEMISPQAEQRAPLFSQILGDTPSKKSLFKVEDSNHQVFEKSTFMKFSPLLDPVRYMIGKYKEDHDIQLPSILQNASDVKSSKTKEKIDNVHNASYVDAFFCYLSSQLLNTHQFIHGIDFYGSYVGLQEKFKTNITDDLDYLYGSSFFKENLNILFSVSEHNELFLGGMDSRKNKQKLHIKTEKNMQSILDIEDLDYEMVVEPVVNDGEPAVNDGEPVVNEEEVVETIYQNDEKSTRTSDDSSDSSNNSETNYSSDSESESGLEESEYGSESGDGESDSGSDSEDSEDEKQVYAYIREFPVQAICMEKCDGTIDELFSKGKIGEKEGASALFQVIMALLTYQKAFLLTHNDLHTNNIMYIQTNQDYLYYVYNGKKYKVPTYGKIFKIIDFGRSIYTFQNKLFCSDSFAPGGDASTQYNCEPFYNPDKSLIVPNYSFDLCRLGCSIYDFIIDEEKYDEMDDFQKTIHRWCLDDNNKNILYKKDGEERYPNFKLYKMIARTVHHHTPEEQLKYSFFNKYETDKFGKKVVVFNLDTLPCYA
jgi:hypothetical protein